MNNDLISREALKKDFEERNKACDKWIAKAKDEETKIRAEATKHFICEVIMTIDNASTVEPTFGVFREMLCSECEKNCTECKEKRPQGDLAEKLKDRIEESICKRCQSNVNCVLCKISRVFQIITLTMEEQKGDTE